MNSGHAEPADSNELSASQSTRVLGRLVRAVGGGALAAGVASGVDALWARQAGGLNLPNAVVSLWGLHALPVLIVAVLVAVVAFVAHPKQGPKLTTYWNWLREDAADGNEGGPKAFALPIALLTVWAWIVALANASRLLFSWIAEPRAAGLAIGAISVVFGLIAIVIGFASYAGVDAVVSRQRRRVRRAFAAWWTGPLALLACASMIGVGIISGSTGGEGGVFGFLGVLKRLELDLRAPALMLAIAGSAFLTSGLRRSFPLVLAVVATLLPVGLLVYGANALDRDPQLAASIERDAPFGKISLKLMRRLSDRDRDGASAHFGGGDCDDRNSAISPLAIDVPGNGIDEDCSGKDRPLPVARSVPSVASASSTPAAAPVSTPKPRNVILISVDTLRWDMGFMGYERPITPALDALAKRGVVFERAYSMSSYTGKAIGPLLTGKYPSETHMGWSHYNKYPEQDIMVQERIQKAGIRTLAVHCHWYFKKDTGLGRGFDLFDLSALPAKGIDATSDTSYSADRLTDAAIKVLSDAANTSGRFYAWVHYFDPHAEYIHHPGTEEFGKKPRDMYDHEVRWTDDHLRRLLEFVEKQPWAANTAIIVTSDHGEAFGEHKMFRHGFEVWEEIVRIPLVVYVPGMKPARLPVRRSQVDLVPTILEIMGVPAPDGTGETDFLSGTSLMADVRGEAQTPREILVDMPPGPFNEARRAYIRDDMKLIIAGGVRYQLFDLAKDPDEQRDLAKDKPLLAKVREQYDAFRETLREQPIQKPK